MFHLAILKWVKLWVKFIAPYDCCHEGLLVGINVLIGMGAFVWKEAKNRNQNGELITLQQACAESNLGSSTVRQLADEAEAVRKIGKSYRKNGKVRKKQTVICTIGYYDIVDYSGWPGEYVTGELAPKADALGLEESELADLIYSVRVEI